MSEVLVSISCITYNHSAYIRQCLDGMLMQQTTFGFEILIHDDCSTDGTDDIIREYASKYPQIIKPLFEEENQYQQGKPIGTAVWNLPRAKGKYIAICEGDDYWTDPLKLQKQVDFMEANPEYVLCCHRYKIYNQNDGTWDKDYVHQLFETSSNGVSFSNKENFETWFTKTLTLLIRQDALRKMPTRKGFKYWRDVHMNYYMLKQGKGFCMPFVGAVCTRHNGGVFSSIGAMNQWRINLKVWNELLCQNREDEVLYAFYLKQHNAYRDYIVGNIFHQQNNEKFLDIKTLFMLDVTYNGMKSVIFSITRMILSLKSLTKKKIKKCINHFFRY